MGFAGLVWLIPTLLLFGVIIAFTLNHNKKTTKLNIILAIISFILSICVIGERLLFDGQDYGYYFDWFVLDNFYYRIGYELNHTSALFLVAVTALNLIMQVLNEQYIASHKKGNNGYLNLIFGLLSAIVISDNVLTYYIISFCISVALFLKLANLNVLGMIHTLRQFSKTFIIGHLLFLCALVLIFYHQPNHAVEFTVIDSSLSIQPDLLNMDNEWIIGLLLVISTVFTSTVLVGFEQQMHKQALEHMVTLYVLMSLKIVLPAYTLIRFESLIRLDDRTELIVSLLGVVLLIVTCIKGRYTKDLSGLLITISSAMLGMLYMLFGLQVRPLLSAVVFVFICAYLFSLYLLLFSKRKRLFTITKLLMAIFLIVPIIMSISASNHYSDYESIQFLVFNVLLWAGMIAYSLTIFLLLFKLERDKYSDSDHILKHSNSVYTLYFFIILLTIVAIMTSWWSESIIDLSNQHTIVLNKQILINILLVCVYIGAGLAVALILTRQKNNGHAAHTMQRLVKPISQTKNIVVFLADKLEWYWDQWWEIAVPYMFKKGERYIAAKQVAFIHKLISLWIISIIIAVLLVIVRG